MNQVIAFIVNYRPWPLITVGGLASIHHTMGTASGNEHGQNLLRSLEKYNGNRRRLLEVRKLWYK